MDRREFLKISGLFALGLLAMNGDAFALRTAGSGATAAGQAGVSRKRLVVVFLRGAVDGMSVVVPYGDGKYYDARPKIALPEAGKPSGVLDLNGYFGLHPALAPLYPLYKSGKMAFVHNCGSPDATRSHFDAQDYMESGTPGVKTTADGWMNRLLHVLPGSHTPTQALNFGPTIPRILSGRETVANLDSGPRGERRLPIDRPGIQAHFDQLYQGNDPLSKAYREGRDSRQTILAELNTEMDPEQQQANNGASLPDRFSPTAQKIARLIHQDPGMKVAFVALGGWDTHINQGNATGALARDLGQLGQGLASLTTGLGDRLDDTMIVVMSEFGRTVKENGNGGTDHGHGNVMWLLGGNVNGGHVYGDWTGLAARNLFEGRDLPVTTDFRAVLGGVLKHHLQLTDSQISVVFPQMPGPVNDRFFRRV